MTLKDAGISLWLKSPMTELVLDGNSTASVMLLLSGSEYARRGSGWEAEQQQVVN